MPEQDDDRTPDEAPAAEPVRPAEVEAEARALMDEGAAALVEGVRRGGANWVVAAVGRIADAWGRFDASGRRALDAAAAAAGSGARDRVAGELLALFALDPADQRVTPLEVIRSLRREATEVLRAAGVPEVERDPFEARAFPDDVYGIVPQSPVELGDDDLGGALLAWGLGKAKLLRARSQLPGGPVPPHSP